MTFPCIKCKIHKYTITQLRKYTNTNCLKDPTCAIFLKSMGFKDIKYDIPVCQIHYIYITFSLHLHYIYRTFTGHLQDICRTFTGHLHIDGASSRSFERHFYLSKILVALHHLRPASGS